jgi:hypothetical protein
MSHVPTEDLIIAARRLDPHCSDVVSQPQWETCGKDHDAFEAGFTRLLRDPRNEEQRQAARAT